MNELDTIHESTGNVFTDLDVPEPEEALAKAELVRRIGHIITRRRLNQAQAAALLGIDQPKVSALLRGKLAGFSTDRLLRFLNALDRDVEIVIKRKPHARKQAQIRIVVA
jgi:predicted XRE-type DNA-binding protein